MVQVINWKEKKRGVFGWVRGKKYKDVEEAIRKTGLFSSKYLFKVVKVKRHKR